MIKLFKYIFLLLIILLIAGVVWHISYLRSLATKNTYPKENWLSTVNDKRALIIVAHDDDAVSCAGTISKLVKEGWDVREFSFYGYSMSDGDNERIKLRKEASQVVKDIEGLKEFGGFDIELRKIPALKPPLSIPYSEFESTYRFDTIEAVVKQLIYAYKPTVIFTLDDSIGGYGHSDHVFISKAILDVCRKEKGNADFPVKKIYQPVFPADMADNIMIKHRTISNDFYGSAKKIYGCTGMPSPDVEVNISEYGGLKKDIMNAYPTEIHNFRKFWQGYQWYPAWFYFRIFDREFFRVLEVKK